MPKKAGNLLLTVVRVIGGGDEGTLVKLEDSFGKMATSSFSVSTDYLARV